MLRLEGYRGAKRASDREGSGGRGPLGPGLDRVVGHGAGSRSLQACASNSAALYDILTAAQIITDAIANDVAFLARAGIQDYSALLGVSDEEHTLNLGVIDVLSTYTFAKALEHKAKMTLRPSTEVTVMPVRIHLSLSCDG